MRAGDPGDSREEAEALRAGPVAAQRGAVARGVEPKLRGRRVGGRGARGQRSASCGGGGCRTNGADALLGSPCKRPWRSSCTGRVQLLVKRARARAAPQTGCVHRGRWRPRGTPRCASRRGTPWSSGAPGRGAAPSRPCERRGSRSRGGRSACRRGQSCSRTSGGGQGGSGGGCQLPIGLGLRARVRRGLRAQLAAWRRRSSAALARTMNSRLEPGAPMMAAGGGAAAAAAAAPWLMRCSIGAAAAAVGSDQLLGVLPRLEASCAADGVEPPLAVLSTSPSHMAACRLGLGGRGPGH